jgi:nucleotide-binding universal stress UspA family protein
VAEVWLSPLPPSGHKIISTPFTEPISGQVNEAHALALEATERLQADFPDWNVCAEAYSGSPAATVLAKADQWKPDLIVVGSHGRTAAGRFFLGSVSHKIVSEARCSVRVVRSRAQRDDFSIRIIIGVDGSPGAEAAVSAVASRAWPSGTAVRVIVASNPLELTSLGHLTPEMMLGVEEHNAEMLEWVLKAVAAATEKLRTAKLTVSSAVKAGDPKRILLDEAESWGADCIFVGATGISGLDRFLLGSVSAAVAARAHCTVEVARTVKKE